jgi:hypothetical protein
MSIELLFLASGEGETAALRGTDEIRSTGDCPVPSGV